MESLNDHPYDNETTFFKGVFETFFLFLDVPHSDLLLHLF